jgi:hypothetical protein
MSNEICSLNLTGLVSETLNILGKNVLPGIPPDICLIATRTFSLFINKSSTCLMSI